MDYIEALGLLHRVLTPLNYCEIGVRHGTSLALAKVPAIGIDPDFEIRTAPAAPLRLFKMTSDDFFAQEEVGSVLEQPIDFAFIDGMHRVESALRDFMNLERHASRSSVIAVDDVLPERMEYATRMRETAIWTGDVYRLVPILRHFRPDLDITVYDVDMKGLAVISRLDPDSRVLAVSYPGIKAEIASGKWSCTSAEAIRRALQPRTTARLSQDMAELATRRRGFMAPRKPRLSAIIAIFDMPREAPRTIRSATLPYQQDVAAEDFEVIVVDNGSKRRLPESFRDDLPRGVTVVDMQDPQPSPVFALNWAAREMARGDILMFAIDGARIFTDRLYASLLKVHDLIEDAFVFTLAWHLGPKVQMISTQEGYNEKVEDRLIESCGWPAAPDALFDISVFAASSAGGYFRPIAESNAFSIPRRLYERMGGFEERFTSPGAGLANLELFQRYVTRPDARNICLLSEGTFHQVHGGVATSGRVSGDVFAAEYQAIFGRPYTRPDYDTMYFGAPRPAAKRFVQESLARMQAGRS